MRVKTSIPAAALAVALALLTLPAGALAGEYFIPEGNSAVTQYSTSFPTAGGEKGGSGGKESKPDKSIGAGNAKKLESQGAEGKAAAELAVETSPETVAVEPAPEPEPAPTPNARPKPKPKKHKQKHSGATPGGGQSGSGGTGNPAQSGKSGGESASPTPPRSQTLAAGEASSGAAEVAAKAIGLESPGNFGVLLPLAILGSLAWAVSYAVRRRRQPLS